jgi:hypothetical protein
MLFEMLSGEPPFLADAIQELMVAHMFHPVPSIGERIPGLPAWLAGLVTIMLAKRRDERPTSMKAVARALGERTNGTQVAPRAVTPRWGRRVPAAAVAIAGLAALGIAVWRGGSAGRHRSDARASEAAVLPAAVPAPPAAALAPPAAPAIASETAPAVPAGIVVPEVPPVAAPVRKAARAPERPRRAPAPGGSKAEHVVDTDGIVDL